MITNRGKNIIAKYLINQAPAYASYIALGCGAQPRSNVNTLTNASSSGTTITVDSTDALFIGAKIRIVSGTGTLTTLEETIVTSITNTNNFEVSPEPVEALSNATLAIEIDPTKETLDFEMFRVPISSRGYVNDNGINKVIFSAQLPTEERYEISEIGIFSAASNTSAGINDSRVLYSFGADEGWEDHGVGTAVAIPIISNPLDNDDDIITQDSVFRTNATNRTFNSLNRLERYERTRFLNSTILVPGDYSNITYSVPVSDASGDGTTVTYTTSSSHNLAAGNVITITGIDPVEYNLTDVVVASVIDSNTFTVTDGGTGSYISGGSFVSPHLTILPDSDHLHLTGESINLDRNSATDILKIAFSIISKDGTSTAVPDSVNVLIEFTSSDVEDQGEFARFEATVVNGNEDGQQRLSQNRYIVSETQLQELYRSSGFTWSAVNVAKIYISALSGGSPTGDYFVALDGIRLENVSTPNPLYGMTGYSIVQNTDSETIVKRSNTNNYVEFRFALDVV